MPYTMGWYIDKEIVYMKCSTALSVAELHACLTEINGYIALSDRPLVHAIIDLTSLSKPLSLVEAAQAMKGYKAPAQMGWTISVGDQDKVVKFLSSVTAQILKVRQRSYNTLDEALAFLKDMDTTIHWDQANQAVLAAGKEN